MVKEKIKNTCLERYGCECALANADIQEKATATKIAKYGNAHYSNREKASKTYMERYGVSNPSQSDEIKEKIRNTWLEKYGVDHPMKNHEIFCKTKQKYEYDGLMFDSKPEILMYKELKNRGIVFTYQPDASFEYEYDGKLHKYYPDFQIGNKYIEIKGLHFFKDRNPHETMICPFNRGADALLYKASMHDCS